MSNWLFPLTKCSGIPINYHPGAFGFKRRDKYHTGVDLYCQEGDPVFAAEKGLVTSVEKFTGPWDNSPWWLNTECILIQGNSGTICYGELVPKVSVGQYVLEGDIIGNITPVIPPERIRKDIPGHSCSMLHLEFYVGFYSKASTSWEQGRKELNLVDPTINLLNAKTNIQENKTLLVWDGIFN